MRNRPPPSLPLGAEWLAQMPTGDDGTPPAGVVGVQPVKEFRLRAVTGRTSGQPTQVVEWLYAEVREANLGGGTGTTAAIRTWVQQEVGRPNDDAGHIVGNNQGGLGSQMWNIFPQHRGFNRGVFSASVERNIADAARTGGGVPVKIWFRFFYEDPTFPGRPNRFSYFIQFPNRSELHSDLLNPLAP